MFSNTTRCGVWMLSYDWCRTKTCLLRYSNSLPPSLPPWELNIRTFPYVVHQGREPRTTCLGVCFNTKPIATSRLSCVWEPAILLLTACLRIRKLFFCLFFSCLLSARQVRVWEISRGYGNQPVTAVPKAQINHDAPVLCTDFSTDGTVVFSGGASKQARRVPLVR